MRNSWDLTDIDRRYQAFIEEYAPVADRLRGKRPPDARDAFVTYLGVVDRWRRLPFRDPGLPPELLAEDWSAPVDTALFEGLVEKLEGRALTHAAVHWRDAHRRQLDQG